MTGVERESFMLGTGDTNVMAANRMVIYAILCLPKWQKSSQIMIQSVAAAVKGISLSLTP